MQPTRKNLTAIRPDADPAHIEVLYTAIRQYSKRGEWPYKDVDRDAIPDLLFDQLDRHAWDWNDDTLIIHLADIVLNGHGVEGWTDPDDYTEGVRYVNMGDTYALTLVLDHGTFKVCSWGDLAEKYPEEVC